MNHTREEQVVHLRENGMEGNIDEQLAAIADAVISIEGHLSRIADAMDLLQLVDMGIYLKDKPADAIGKE